MAIVTSCRSDMSPEGLSRHAQLADGRMHLVLVHQCSILQYLKFLSLIPTCGESAHRFLAIDADSCLAILGPLRFLLTDSSTIAAKGHASSTRNVQSCASSSSQHMRCFHAKLRKSLAGAKTIYMKTSFGTVIKSGSFAL